ncbi:hypothetical protein [Kineococcus aurantiacus]|uniref:Uncharacterized protein n=1 Tax=Kineococcus aurantiacus TaxID=37633 RepID=A0A7Y9DNV8_9ACTN|nr:hypothetical protein [Kineococcus aurantiacus]NYD24078.1 hypothetical protein [Kineococcus aurantiacus]
MRSVRRPGSGRPRPAGVDALAPVLPHARRVVGEGRRQVAVALRASYSG